MKNPRRANFCGRQLLAMVVAEGFTLGLYDGAGAVQVRTESTNFLGEHWRSDLAAWRRAKGADARREASGQLVESAMRADRPDLVEALAAGAERQLCEGEVRLPRRAGRRVRLTTVREFPELRTDGDHFPRENGDWLARRITRDALEVWSPRHG